MILNMTGGGSGDFASMINSPATIQSFTIEDGKTIEANDFIQFNNGSWSSTITVDSTTNSGYGIVSTALENGNVLCISHRNSSIYGTIYSVSDTSLTKVSEKSFASNANAWSEQSLCRLSDNLYMLTYVNGNYNNGNVRSVVFSIVDNVITTHEEKVIATNVYDTELDCYAKAVVYDENKICVVYKNAVKSLTFIVCEVVNNSVNVLYTQTYTNVTQGISGIGGLVNIGNNKFLISYIDTTGNSLDNVCLVLGTIDDSKISFGTVCSGESISISRITQPLLWNNSIYVFSAFYGSNSGSTQMLHKFTMNGNNLMYDSMTNSASWDTSYIFAEQIWNNIVLYIACAGDMNPQCSEYFSKGDCSGISTQIGTTYSYLMNIVNLPSGRTVVLNGNNQLYANIKSQPTITKSYTEFKQGIALESGSGGDTIKVLIFGE